MTAETSKIPVGIISRAQRYKKDAKIEQDVLKICVFLSINNKYMPPDSQSIALRTALSSALRRSITPPIAKRAKVSTLKKLKAALFAVSYVF